MSDISLPWIEAQDNRWGIRLLDLRPLTQTVLSTSKDPQMAENALSYNTEDGTSFIGLLPREQNTIPANIGFPIDGRLVPGVLFTPAAMEHKWAIYFHDGTLIFVRSWFREVFATARTTQRDGMLIVEEITGDFAGDESPEFTKSFLTFLLLSHAIGAVAPAPLPSMLEASPKEAGIWAFSAYGNRAHVGTFEPGFLPANDAPLRTHTLLHIATARGDLEAIKHHIRQGTGVDCLAGDGLAPLHWSLAHDDLAVMEKLLALGAEPNVRSAEGATPLMNAAQSNKIAHLKRLIQAGGDVNAGDGRGFTALHRAAEIGHEEIVRILLENGADREATALDHTPRSLAEMGKHQTIIRLLQKDEAPPRNGLRRLIGTFFRNEK